jgi:hypothetical protein
MWYIRVFFQKIHKISFKIFGFGKDIMIRNLLKIYNIKYAVLIYDMITYSPIENIILLLCSKFGVSKIIALMILAFVL